MGDTSSRLNVEGLYDVPKDTIDVVYIGASEITTDYLTTNAWREYGYTSYTYGINACTGDLYPYMMREVLKYQNPSLFVVEITPYLVNDDYYKDTTTYKYGESIRWSQNKVDLIKNLSGAISVKDYIFPLNINHIYWNNVAEGLKYCRYRFDNRKLPLGFETTTNVAKGLPSEEKVDIYFTDKSKGHLLELLDYCKEQNIENVLFVRYPHAYIAAAPEKIDEIQNLVEDYGYDFLDTGEDYELTGIEPSNDFYDTQHLNVYGMEKFTSFLGEYISQRYSISGNHSEEENKLWDAAAERLDKVVKKSKEYIGNNELYQYQGYGFVSQ